MDVKDLVESKKVLLFDLDGTLVDLEQLNYTSFRNTVKEFWDKELTYEEYLEYFSGSGSKGGFERYFEAKGIEPSFLDSVFMSWRRSYRKLKWHALKNDFERVVTVKDGAVKFLEVCKERGKIIVLCTSSARVFAKFILEKAGMLGFFDHLVTIEDMKRTKPDPECFYTGLRLAQGNPEEAVIFEDSKNGILSAKNSGIDYVCILTKGMNDRFVEGEKYVVEDYMGLL